MHSLDPHQVYIPVLGTGFSIDTPIKVAKYGISSVISLVDDVLIEQMRKHYSNLHGYRYEPINDRKEDHRALRIEKYLNLVGELVEESIQALRTSPFAESSEITRYFQLLPECAEKSLFEAMSATSDFASKHGMQESLRKAIVPGSIDVNIMTKLDRDIYKGATVLDHKYADAMSALRGYANSKLDSTVELSAGLNRKLFSYFSEFVDFFPNSDEQIKKKVALKVSDFRSAMVQGRFLAKHGIWVSEYRIESGINCGGHAFPTQGILFGPILEEFRTRKGELTETLFLLYVRALHEMKKPVVSAPPPICITVQGGIITPGEQRFLIHHFGVDRTGWGTPFLFVREVTQLDDSTFEVIKAASKGDSYLSDSSPLGIPFWNIHSTPSEQARRDKIEKGKPGSACPKRYLVSNTEFSLKPVCTASRKYQQMKLKQIFNDKTLDLKTKNALQLAIEAKSCLCQDLSGGVTRRLRIGKNIPTAVCPGPSVIYFDREIGLDEMFDHIYGRCSSVLKEKFVPHMFIREAEIYVEYYKSKLQKCLDGLALQDKEWFVEFRKNLLDGVSFYEDFVKYIPEPERIDFSKGLLRLRGMIESLEA